MDEKLTKQVSYEDILPFIEQSLSIGKDIRFKPRGTSMLPFIRQNNDEVILTAFKGKLKKYDIIFYRRTNGQFVLHRYLKKGSDGSYLIRGDHQTEIEKGITDENIIGVVKSVVRKNRTISAGTPLFVFWGAFGPIYCRTIRRAYNLKKKLLQKREENN